MTNQYQNAKTVKTFFDDPLGSEQKVNGTNRSRNIEFYFKNLRKPVKFRFKNKKPKTKLKLQFQMQMRANFYSIR